MDSAFMLVADVVLAKCSDLPRIQIKNKEEEQ